MEVKKSENRKLEEVERTEFYGVEEEEEDGMSVEEGDRIDGEEELAPPDWRVRAEPRNKPTPKEREEHEATLVPFTDWCVHCMMARGRTHHHVTKLKSVWISREDPLFAMDCYFMGMKSVVNGSKDVKRISNLHRGERRQTSEHDAQCYVVKRSGRTVDNRESDENH